MKSWLKFWCAHFMEHKLFGNLRWFLKCHNDKKCTERWDILKNENERIMYEIIDGNSLVFRGLVSEFPNYWLHYSTNYLKIISNVHVQNHKNLINLKFSWIIKKLNCYNPNTVQNITLLAKVSFIISIYYNLT